MKKPPQRKERRRPPDGWRSAEARLILLPVQTAAAIEEAELAAQVSAAITRDIEIARQKEAARAEREAAKKAEKDLEAREAAAEKSLFESSSGENTETADLNCEPTKTLALYDIDQVEKKSSDERLCKDSDERNALSSLLKRLTSLGGQRPLGLLSVGWKGKLSALRSQFQNFVEVIDFIETCSALGDLDGGHVTIPSILLVGPPGVGKTLFCRQLASIIGTSFLSISAEQLTTSAALIGSDESWGNSKTGLIFQELVFGMFANPLILLDEIEKIPNSFENRYDSRVALLSLLSDQAKHYIDLSAKFLTIDASHITYIATANSTAGIDAPLLSRLRQFDIEAPTAAQMRDIVARIFTEATMIERPATRCMYLSDEAIECLSKLESPRQIKPSIIAGLGKAILKGKIIIEPDDLPPDRQKAKRPIGF